MFFAKACCSKNNKLNFIKLRILQSQVPVKKGQDDKREELVKPHGILAEKNQDLSLKNLQATAGNINTRPSPP
jgi:hypothetical protein